MILRQSLVSNYADLSLEGGPGVPDPLAGQEAEAEGGHAEQHRLVEGEGGLLHKVAELVLQQPEHEHEVIVRISTL